MDKPLLTFGVVSDIHAMLAVTARPTPLFPKEFRNTNGDSAMPLSPFGGDNVWSHPTSF
jgi:hypothetical protein